MRAHTKKKLNRNWLYGYIFIFPTVGAFLVFSLIPSVAIFILSVFNWDLVSPAKFIGLGNYRKMFSDPGFWKSLSVTFLYVLYNLPAQIIIALLLAVLMNRPLKGVKVFRVIYLIPWVTTPVAVSIVWKWVLNPTSGVMNYFVGLLGIDRVNWFSSAMALKSVVLVNVWQHTGYITLLLLVGIQGIPRLYYEAANIDGANRIQTFWHVTLPLMKPVLLFVLITGFISSFQVFDSVYTMTEGGPGDATKVYYFTIYQQAFQFLNMGYASALSVILFLILMSVTIIQLRLFRNTTYEMN